MSEIIGQNIAPDSSTTLRKMLKNNLTPYMTQFEVISTGASKVSLGFHFRLFWIILHEVIVSSIY